MARIFATLDHLSGGRGSWNIVTSLNVSEARNFGRDQHLDHGARYDRADEFVSVVSALWSSWEEDALILDAKNGRFADPSKVHYLDHRGEWFNVRGPLQVPRSPQKRPVLIQAGASSRGRDFATKWADVILSIQPDVEAQRKHYADFKGRLSEAGRDPASCKLMTAVMPIIGATEQEAREKQAYLDSLVDPRVGLSTLSSHTGFDLSTFPLDTALDEILPSFEGTGIRSFVETIRSHRPGLRYVARPWSHYGQGVLIRIVETAGQIARSPDRALRYTGR